MKERTMSELQVPSSWVDLMRAKEEAAEQIPCETSDPEAWFPDHDDYEERVRMAKKLCATCPIQLECLRYALEHEQYGIWGGLTPRQRQKLLARKRAA